MKYSHQHFVFTSTEPRLIHLNSGGPEASGSNESTEAKEPATVIEVRNSIATLKATIDDPNTPQNLKRQAEEAKTELEAKIKTETALTEEMTAIVENNKGNKETIDQTKDRLKADLNEKAINLISTIKAGLTHTGRNVSIQTPKGSIPSVQNGLTSDNIKMLNNAITSINLGRNNPDNTYQFAAMIRYATNDYNTVAKQRGLAQVENIDIEKYNVNTLQSRQEFVVNSQPKATENVATAESVETKAMSREEVDARADEMQSEILSLVKTPNLNEAKTALAALQTEITDLYSELSKTKDRGFYSPKLFESKKMASRADTVLTAKQTIRDRQAEVARLGQEVGNGAITEEQKNQLVQLRQDQVYAAYDIQNAELDAGDATAWQNKLLLAQNIEIKPTLTPASIEEPEEMIAKAEQPKRVLPKQPEISKETLAVQMEKPAEVSVSPKRVEASRQSPATETITVSPDAVVKVKFDTYANEQVFTPKTSSMGNGVTGSNEYQIVRNGDQVTINSALPFTYEVEDETANVMAGEPIQKSNNIG